MSVGRTVIPFPFRLNTVKEGEFNSSIGMVLIELKLRSTCRTLGGR